MQEPSVLAIIADVASLASLAGTILVWFQAKAIKRSVLRSARVPDTLRDLQKLSDELRLSLRKWPEQERESTGVLAKADAVLANVLPKLVGAERKKLQESKALIRKRTAPLRGWLHKEASFRRDAYWDIYDSLLGAIEALNQLNEDHTKRI